jgi:hypothetical protein
MMKKRVIKESVGVALMRMRTMRTNEKALAST